MRRHVSLIKFLICFFQCYFGSALIAQTSQFPIDEEFILKLMDQENIPGISIAIIRQDQIFAKSFGVKNANLPGLVDNETIFEAASLTKPVTGFVALEMLNAELLDLDRPLYQYVDYPDISHDERHELITARMVLNHTTGFPNGRRDNGLKIYVEPASSFGYSGEAFRYLQSAMESISGDSLDVLAEQYVFNQLGMNSSSYLWREDAKDNAATGHAIDGSVSRELYNLNKAYAEGGLETNIVDYSLFINHILERYKHNDAVIHEMFTPSHIAADYDGDGEIYWGLGWGLDVSEERNRAWHTGSNGPFKSFVVIDLNSSLAVVCFLNSANGLEVMPEIVESLMGNSSLAEFYQQTIVDSMK